VSDLIYNHALKTLTLRDRDGATVGTWPANNNVDSRVGLAGLPNGVYQIRDKNTSHRHPTGDTSDGGYGPAGIIRIEDFHFHGKKPHEGVGIHSGRKHLSDGAGRAGVNHATMLCVRTTDQAMSMITMIMRGDPLNALIVEKSSVHSGFVTTAHLRKH
jgi:hypothetical protein